ncbi:DUF2746 domain-containing protein [Arthrobacter sp. VKM Ac-2550]|uniref:DUF2746 domain-containing protein n=1 Tax=Crystallibacter permensis TaxID=1938888 RepID=UPI002226BA1F|nr:DUF2746 domain-containing protein [Arthrobacter sp. VKM Ac-2550]MCW2132873.1 hypothetical protein [Arthrobacter sp. VKM Ac-2550]
MPTWIQALFQDHVIGWIITACFVLWVASRIWKPVSKFVRLVDALVGNEDNPGVVDRMTAQGETLSTMNHKLDENTREVAEVKKQVQNSHVTNMREDLDKAIGSSQQASETSSEVKELLEQHLVASKAETDDTARIFAKYLPILNDLLGDEDPKPKP